MDNMKQLDEELKKLSRKSKMKRWLLTFLIVVVTFFVLLIGFYKGTQALSRKHYLQIDEEFRLIQQFQSPNISSDSRYIDQSDWLGGTLISHRHKNIDGYRVTWGPMRGNFSWLNGNRDTGNDGVEYLMRDDVTVAAYDRVTNLKLPLFYNQPAEKSMVTLVNELTEIKSLTNQLAEVAITFDQEYSYQEIQKMIPETLLINWYWLGTNPLLDSTEGYVVGVDGDEKTGEISQDSYEIYYASLNNAAKKSTSNYNYTVNDVPLYEDAFAKIEKNSKIEEVQFSGILVSGKTENLASLKDAPWLHTASVGATVTITPFIEPLK